MFRRESLCPADAHENKQPFDALEVAAVVREEGDVVAERGCGDQDVDVGDDVPERFNLARSRPKIDAVSMSRFDEVQAVLTRCLARSTPRSHEIAMSVSRRYLTAEALAG